MAEEEQVLGVLKRCPICDEKTLHVDGVCQDHRVVRRKKKKQPAAAPPAPPPAPPKKSNVGRVISVLILGAAIFGFGAVHIVHGDRTGFAICRKTGWTLADTIINSDDKITDKDVLAAMVKCELFTATETHAR